MLKNWDINLQRSEKKTLLSFLLLYLIFSLLILAAFGLLYYKGQKELMLQELRIKLSTFANEQALRLKDLHVNFDKQRIYPRSDKFESAIYDAQERLIFSTFGDTDIDFDSVIYLDNGYIYLLKEPESFYLGTKYLVLRIASDGLWLQSVIKTLVVYGAGLLLLMMAMGYFLMSLLLKPMRDAIALLDRFIKDTTHELNTPVNAIMSNIEMIDRDNLDEKLAKKIKRIDIGARTVSNLYQDLTYLTLAHKIVSHDEDVNISRLIHERLEYFALFMDSKKIVLSKDIKEDIHLFIDSKKFAKLIDNLLSNAVKYNKIGGSIHVRLNDNELIVQDSGRGIAKEKLDLMFQRYSRADSSVGGFGIGLSIVLMIVNEYNLKIKLDSQEGEWTKVSVTW